MRAWWSKIRLMLTGRQGLPEDLHDEIRAHLEMEIQEQLARGMPEEQARKAARIGFGNTTLIQERAHEAWTFNTLETLAKDLMYAATMVRKSPGFAITAVLTLALGIGGITAMFTLIRGELLKPLDFPEPDRLVEVLVSGSRRGQPDLGFNLIRYREMQKAPCFSAFGASSGIHESVTLSGRAREPESVRESRISANFLNILGVSPLLGRGFLPSEDRPGGPDVALVSYGLWKRWFGGNPNIAGKSISLDARPYTVVGVLPPHFDSPWSGYDVWVTRPWEWSEVPAENWQRVLVLSGLARLKPGVSLEQARAELNVLSRQYALAHPGLPDADSGASMKVERLQDRLVRDLRPLLWMLFDAVGFVLLIVCANVADLLLARSAARSREFSVRAALGASRRRLIQQMLAESVSLALIGGALGIPLANGILAVMLRIGPVARPRSDQIHMDWAVLAFAAAVSIATGLVFGLLPAGRISRPDLADFLREQGALAGRAFSPRKSLGLGGRGFLVVAQVALCMVLLVGAGLMLESFVRLRDVSPGFQPAHLLTMEIALPTVRYDTNQKRQAFWDELVQRAGALRGVYYAAVARSVPTTITDVVAIQNAQQPGKELSRRPLVNNQTITPAYFRTFGIPLLQGRDFTADDRDGAPRVAIINETLARRFWPSYPKGPSPIGQHLLAGNKGTSLEIVGVVSDVHEDGLASEVKPEVYSPSAQYPPQTAFLVVRTATTSFNFANAVRSQVTSIDPAQSVFHVQSMSQLLSASLGGTRLTLILLGSFAGVAVALALIGIYGVIAFLVVERTQEFGIRQALGAQGADILKLVLGRGLSLMFTGLAFGIAVAVVLSRIMRGFLFHVSATDPWTFAGTSVLFLAVGLVACYLPARRATRMDPALALR